MRTFSLPDQSTHIGEALFTDGTNVFWAPVAGGIGGTGTSKQVAYFTGISTIASSADFAWDYATKILAVGDITNTGNRNKMGLNDATGVSYWNVTRDFTIYQAGTSPKVHFLADVVNRIYKLGDAQTAGNGTHIEIKDSTSSIIFNTPASYPLSTNSRDIPITIKKSLTSSDILNIGSTPIAVMTVPAGYMILPLEIYCEYIFNTTPYTVPSDIGLTFDTSGGLNTIIISIGKTLLTNAANTAGTGVHFGGGSMTGIGSYNGQTLYICSDDLQSPIGGDGDLDIWVTYKVVKLA